MECGNAEGIVHEPVEGTDLAVFPRIQLEKDISFKVSGIYLDCIGVTPTEMIAAARENSRKQYTVRTMAEIMSEIMGIPAEELPETNMVVISNQQNCQGASAITDPETLEKACSMLGTKHIYIIPSSVHELICVPEDSLSPAELEAMIKEINEGVVSKADRLSDHPYLYDGTELRSVKTISQEQKLTAGKKI